MDHSNTIHSFVAVIGDIKDSRLLENRKEVQLRLREVLERLNENYKEEIVSRFLITLGDEFQGLGADGPGYYRAREAVELLKEREKKNRPVLAELCLKMDEKLRDKEILLNTVFDLMYVVESGWTERQREVIWDMLLHGDGQQNTAGRLDITQSTVQKTLAAGSYYTYESALRNAAKILGEIRDD